MKKTIYKTRTDKGIARRHQDKQGIVIGEDGMLYQQIKYAIVDEWNIPLPMSLGKSGHYRFKQDQLAYRKTVRRVKSFYLDNAFSILSEKQKKLREQLSHKIGKLK